MADKKNAYGTSTNETSFRRKWDRAEWEAIAAEKAAQERAQGKAWAEARAAGKKYIRSPTPEDATMVGARAERINFTENLNKTILVPAGAGVGKRGRSAGFYCEHCDLTFKDSLQWVDHLNSKQHLHAIGKTGEVEEATLEMVRARLEMLVRRRREQEMGVQVDLKKRLEERAKAEEAERATKREKRKALRKRKRAGEIKIEEREDAGIPGSATVVGGVQKVPQEEEEEEEEDADAVAMARMMGFSGGFGSTKKN